MIVTTPEELDAFRNGDAGRCTALAVVPGPLGVEVQVRCRRAAWHTKAHRADIGNGLVLRWPGCGNRARTRFVELPPPPRAPA